MCKSFFTPLGSSMTRFTSASVMFSVTRVNGPVSLCCFPDWGDASPPVTGEPDLWRSLTSFGRPLLIVPLFGGGVVDSPNFGVVVVRVAGEASPGSLSESWILIILGDLVKRLSGPHCPVPLLLFSYKISKTGSLICFLCKILLSDVVMVCIVPDMAICVLSEYELSNLGLFIFFFKKKNG